jgi:uncharacterized membrane protein
MARVWSRPLLVLVLASWAAAWGMCALRIDLPMSWRWFDGLAVAITTASTLLGLMERLPVQNALWAGALIGTLAVIIETLQATSHVPFGPRQFADGLGSLAFGVLPWPIPFVWICLLLNSRGVARLMLRPWRADRHYGYWVIGLAGLLTVLLALGLEPFATRVQHYWTWKASPSAPAWYGAPWYSFLSWFGCSAGILALTTPWLINKHPIKQPVSYQPLILWGLFGLLLATVNGTNGLWLAGVVGLAATVCVVILACRGARWKTRLE